MASRKKPQQVEPPTAEAPTGTAALWYAARPASALDSFAKLKILLTGPSGGGKTTTGARFERPLYVPTELQAIPVVRSINPDAIVFHNADGRPGLRNSSDLQQFRAMIRDPDLPNKVDAVVLDSLTDCQRIIKDAYTKAQTTGTSQTDMNTWGSIIDLTARLAREVRDLEVHVLVTVLDEEKEEHGRLVHRPGVFGKRLPNDLAQYFNVVGFAHSEEMEDGEIRYQTLIRAGGDKYIVKGLPELDDVEPPEPLLWAAKVFGDDTTEIKGLMERVQKWRSYETDDEPDEEDAPAETNGKEEKPDKGDDPFADL